MLGRLQETLLRTLASDRLLPRSALREILAFALDDLRLGLCLHRVGSSRAPGRRTDDMNIASDKLDDLLELLLARRRESRWLSVTFDDGYADAAEYVRTRAARYPSVEFVLFVCPAKLVNRQGFRWDLPEGSPHSDPFGPPFDPEVEATREDLAGLADHPESRLVTVEECRRLRDEYGVVLGNHSNQHLQFSAFDEESSRREIRRSRSDFERLFGATPHFAFPFGTIGRSFEPRDARLVFEAGYEHAWSTEPRPYAAEERQAGHVLPRIGIFGTQSVRSMAALVALRALRFRVRGGQTDRSTMQ